MSETTNNEEEERPRLPRRLARAVGSMSAQMIGAEAEMLSHLCMAGAKAGFTTCYAAIGLDPDAEESTADMAAPESMKVLVIALTGRIPRGVLQEIADKVAGIAQDTALEMGLHEKCEFKNGKNGGMEEVDPPADTEDEDEKT